MADHSAAEKHMAAIDLQVLAKAISSRSSPLKVYKPDDRDAEAEKIVRLRQLRLASTDAVRKLARGVVPTRAELRK
jgi:hypothetical protein